MGFWQIKKLVTLPDRANGAVSDSVTIFCVCPKPILVIAKNSFSGKFVINSAEGANKLRQQVLL
jgi:hypothetical protein